MEPGEASVAALARHHRGAIARRANGTLDASRAAPIGVAEVLDRPSERLLEPNARLADLAGDLAGAIRFRLRVGHRVAPDGEAGLLQGAEVGPVEEGRVAFAVGNSRSAEPVGHQIGNGRKPATGERRGRDVANSRAAVVEAQHDAARRR